ncbi:copper transport protein ctr4 [Hypoxylon trugodes]|uniref:copper transport protein ctr4 n=1 Tax=Hypoxylon trugodes TaxID=326681 RepID=UPI002197846D|nr:copper transport protein ctr4 [Hypoxylon trugodes]KAI1390604.1 copper transport protein ctr4 [Hypoxylon trugodes]
MDHSHMDDSSNATCTHAMTWNWNTVGTCFLAESWRVENEGGFAASCIGVFVLVICLEFLRRLGKEYDSFILRQFQQHVAAQARASKAEDSCCSDTPALGPQVVTFRAAPLQQLIRSVIHALAFGVAYILMLIAMAFNGYIIICIIIGAGVGKFLCDWMIAKVVIGGEGENQPKKAAGLEEASVCCG